jgi:RNA polymerase sigma-70 factor (ECF subfamily)
MDHWDDQHVIDAVLDGDTDVYAVLVKRYEKPIYSLMFRMTGSREDAADLSQETFIKAFEQLHRFKTGCRFFPWLYTIALNHSKDFLSQRKATQTLSLEDWDLDSGRNHPEQQEEDLCAQLDSHHLRAALAELPLNYREAVVLRYREDCSMDEIAGVLKISLSGAKMRVYRGLQKLREILERSVCGKEQDAGS